MALVLVKPLISLEGVLLSRVPRGPIGAVVSVEAVPGVVLYDHVDDLILLQLDDLDAQSRERWYWTLAKLKHPASSTKHLKMTK